MCCGRFIDGDAHAPTAEALMRSRYTAYARGALDYLHATGSGGDPDTAPVWTGLEIVSTARGGVADTEGTVEFVASYVVDGRRHALHEASRFERGAEGRWFYVGGEVRGPRKVGRNEPCPCGSGRKFKRCCGR